MGNDRSDIQSLVRDAKKLPPEHQRGFIEANAATPEIAARAMKLLMGGGPTASLGGGRAAAPRSDATPPAHMQDKAVSIEHAQRCIGDRYEIIGFAGSGGFGTVFQARDRRLDRPVAIKFLKHTNAFSSHDIQNEAVKAAALRHEGLALVLDVDQNAESPHLVMEWIEGLPLDRAWSGSLRHRVSLIAMLAEALAHAHRKGLLHGDVKPANVLVDREGSVKLVDFGLVSTRMRLEDHRCFGGTPGYGAPEQFQNGVTIGPTADIWSLGVILYRAMTGQLPFHADDPLRTIELSSEQDPPLPESRAPRCPEDLQRICLKALERDAALRYADADEFLIDLRRYVNREEVLARPTLLERGFTGGLNRQLREYSEWRRLGLITRSESVQAERHVRSMLQAESEWILESRKIQPNRVALYFGAWLVVLSIAVGLARSWSDFGVWASTLGASIVLALLAGGFAAMAHRTRALAIVLPLAGSISAAAYIAILFNKNNYLAPTEGDTQLVSILNIRPVAGLGNEQLLVTSLIAVALGTLFRLLVKSTAFTLFAGLSLIIACAVLVAMTANLTPESPIVLAQLAVRLLPLALPALIAGMILERREIRTEHQFTLRTRSRDAGVLMLLSTALLLAIMTAIAETAPGWYWGVRYGEEYPQPEQSSIALIVNGMLILVLSAVLDAQPGVIANRIGSALRFLVPVHIIGGLVALEYQDAYEARALWLALVFAASFMLLAISIPKQWKSYVLSGLAGLGIGYARLMTYFEDRAAEQLIAGTNRADRARTLTDAREAAEAAGSDERIAITLGGALLGLAIILITMKASRWAIVRRLKRWRMHRETSKSFRPPDATPSPDQ